MQMNLENASGSNGLAALRDLSQSTNTARDTS